MFRSERLARVEATALTTARGGATTLAAVLAPAVRRAGTECATMAVRAASTSWARAWVGAAVVRTGFPAGIAVVAARAIVWAAESMAALRVAAAWRALRGDKPACTI